MKDLQIKRKFIELRSLGKSFKSIADELGVSKQTLIDWSKEFCIEIANLRTVQIDSLIREADLHLEGHLSQLRLINQKIHEEISRRDLSEVSAEKLIELWFKTFECAQKEQSKITFSHKRENPFDIFSSGTIESWTA